MIHINSIWRITNFLVITTGFRILGPVTTMNRAPGLPQLLQSAVRIASHEKRVHWPKSWHSSIKLL
jgi:hypothetical protein